MPPQQKIAIDDIRQTLKEGAAKDRYLAAAAKGKVQANAAVESALLPPINSALTDRQQAMNTEKRFNVAVNNMPARNFFMGLVEGTDYNMVVSPQLTGNISINLKNVTVGQAMEAVRDAYGYEFRRTRYGFEVLPQTLTTQVFTVNYPDVQRKGRSQIALSSSQISDKIGSTSSGSATSTTTNLSSAGSSNNATSGTTVETRSESDFWKNLSANLKLLIGDKDGRSVVVNSQTGTVMVKAFPAELRDVRRYLENAQNSLERQVILEAKVLEVQLNDGFQAGIDWSRIGTMQFQQTGSSYDKDLKGIFAIKRGDASSSFQATINLLEEQGNVQVLSSPRVSAINNQQAVIKVGDDEFFVTSVTTNVVGGTSGNTTSSSVGLTPFFAGITLDVTPQISSANEIVLHIHPSVSTVETQTKKVELGSNAGGTLTLPLARSTVRESDSVVHARNGQIIVIGGLMQNNTEEHLAGAPGVNRIPFLGALFRNTKQSSTKSELVILLRAVVVGEDTWANEMDVADARIKKLNRGFHAGSRPEVFGTLGEQ